MTTMLLLGTWMLMKWRWVVQLPIHSVYQYTWVWTSLHEKISCDLLCNVAYKSRLRCWLTEERHTCWLGYFSEQEKPRSVLSSSILWLFLCQISFRLKMHCMIYSVQDVESKCSLVTGNICWVPLSLSKSKWVLICAPDKKQVFEPWVHIWVFDEQI